MGSRNGTILNKERIDVPVKLKDGDEIIIGKNILRAEKDATISKVLATAGDSFAVDQVIMEFE